MGGYDNQIYIPNDSSPFAASHEGARSVSNPHRQKLANKSKSSINNAISSNSIGKHSRGKNARMAADSYSNDPPAKQHFGIKKKSGNYTAVDRSKSRSHSRQDRFSQRHSSHSPHISPNKPVSDVVKCMEDLTNHRARIDENTKLLINGSEVLSQAGIAGKIHKVGVGFGTGRHTQGRRSNNNAPGSGTSKMEVVIQSTKSFGKKAPNRHQSELSPKTRDMRNRSVGARTATHKSLASIGCSAKPSTKKSLRS